jgi:hypothetical protein
MKSILFLNPKKTVRTKKRRTTRKRTRRNPARTVAKCNPVRRRRKRVTRNPSRRRRVARRNPARRRASRRAFNIKDLLHRDMLMLGSGVVAGGFAATWVMASWGGIKLVQGTPVAKTDQEFVLPGLRVDATGQIPMTGQILYSIVIPLTGAWAAAQFGNRDFAKGMAIAAVSSGINSAVDFATKAVSGAAAPAVAGAGEYFDNVPALGGNSGTQAVGDVFDSSPAFTGAFDNQ